MKCRRHDEAEAVAVCVNCGIALCAGCASTTPSGRTVCSEACEQAALSAEAALELIRTGAPKGYRLAGGLLVCMGALMLLTSLVPGVVDGRWQIAVVGAVFATAVLVAGFLVRRMGQG
jgi:hypothetical protein